MEETEQKKEQIQTGIVIKPLQLTNVVFFTTLWEELTLFVDMMLFFRYYNFSTWLLIHSDGTQGNTISYHTNISKSMLSVIHLQYHEDWNENSFFGHILAKILVLGAYGRAKEK